MSEGIFGLLGVVIGVGISILWEFVRDKRNQNKSARYLAIRVVTLLDRFVVGCARVADDDGLYKGQPDEDDLHSIQVDSPAYDVDQLDVDWRSAPPEMMYQALGLTSKIEAAESKIHGAFLFQSDPPDFSPGFAERQYSYAVLGVDASQLADKFREKFGIVERDTEAWDPRAFCEKKRDDVLNLWGEQYFKNVKRES